MKCTPLYDDHVKLGGRIVEFGGWQMPVQYSGLADEHETCRTKAGLFDVSHMGEIRVKGKNALAFLNGLVTNDVSKISNEQAIYTVMCYPHGGCVDDLIIYKIHDEEFFICVNASNTDKDFQWMEEQAKKTNQVTVENESPQWGQIAVQGRFAEKTLQKLTDTQLSPIKYYWFKRGKVSGTDAIISRTGYTGEDGFEVYVPSQHTSRIWNALLEEGSAYGIKPCGLGARDTLRTEMKYALYGHEIDEKLNPLEAGLGWVVKLGKSDFIGKASLLKLKEDGLKRTLVGLKTLDKAIPRQGYPVELQGETIGAVTSGTLSPCLKHGIAIAYVDTKHSQIGTKLDVKVRTNAIPHEVVVTPFYKRNY